MPKFFFSLLRDLNDHLPDMGFTCQVFKRLSSCVKAKHLIDHRFDLSCVQQPIQIFEPAGQDEASSVRRRFRPGLTMRESLLGCREVPPPWG